MTPLLKPKIVQDVKALRKGYARDNFVSLPQRVNLSYENETTVSVTRFGKLFMIAVALVVLFFGSVVAPTTQTWAANVTSEAERAELENQLKDLEKQIDQYQDQITSYQKQGSTLKNQIGSLNSKIAQLNLQIKAINLTLSQLDRKINDTQTQIGITEENISRNQEALSELVRNLHRNERASLIEIFLKNPRLSDFFGNLNSITLLQNDLRLTINQIEALQEELKEQKAQFSIARSDAETVKKYQAAQLNQTDQLKAEKNNLLTVTKGEESKYQELLKKTQATASEIRSRIFRLLGGGQLTFEQAYEYAKLAGSATGVRPAFILAILDRESALGQNVGRCSYKTAMSPANQPIFLEITKELNVNPETMLVSCPNADGVYGGAMGPAQFIPSTWMGYRDSVSKITGNKPASPWNNSDAFVAAGLYLRDAGASSNERNAAARYYCGSRWNRYVCTNVYGQKVVDQAARFQKDIDAISG